MEIKKILHFSPVKKESEILKLHLNSLENLEKSGFQITYSFYDDNTDEVSSQLLKDFKLQNENTIIWNFDIKRDNENSNERWYNEAYDRITLIKDAAISEFVKSDYDFLFLTDADLILHPKTVANLFEQNKDFISMIFWTKFEGVKSYFPNAWMNTNSWFYNVEDFLNLKLKKIVPVDFTGACTLLSKKITFEGVRFESIPQLKNSYKGEDKFFCIRAGVLGYQPYVSTHYPAFHLYNLNLVDAGNKWINDKYSYYYLYEEWLNDSWKKEIDVFFKNMSRKKTKLEIVKQLIHNLLKG